MLRSFLFIALICIGSLNCTGQNVGIGTTTPLAHLHVADSNVVFSAEGQVPAVKGDPPVSGSGRRMMWYADKAAFRAGFANSTSWEKDNVGTYSFAGGFGVMASGVGATAFGVNSIATNHISFASGNGTAATGHSATAMGFATVAPSAGEMAVGAYNTLYTPVNANFMNPADRAFVVGIGYNELTRQDAFTILKNGKTGIGTSTPAARLHVADSSVVFSTDGDVPATPGNPPVSGMGRRMMWYADKAAFRAGFVGGTGWDNANVGNYSVALGNRVNASGENAVSMGYGNISAGQASIALGYSTNARANYSLSAGHYSETNGVSSFAMGSACETTGFASIALGSFSKASGSYATAMGDNVVARAQNSLAIGSFNDSIITASTNTWIDTDPVFTVGNGTADNNRRNAFIILKNGKTGIGTSTPTARLQVLDSSVVFSSDIGALASPGPPPVSGEGKRMLWYADKAAFRVGYVSNNEWDMGNVGYFSYASGHSTIAAGTYSTATGIFSKAMAPSSTATGFSTTAHSNNEFVVGSYNTDYVPNSVQLWDPNDRLFVVGNGINSSNRSNALVIFKNGNIDYNNYFRIGQPANGPDFSGLMFGYNVSGKQADAGKIQYGGFGGSTHVLNVVGGGSSVAGSDRTIKLWSEGGLRVRGNTLPDADNGYSLGQSGARWSAVWAANGVIQTSDARLKTNIASLHYGLKELMQMQPVQYNWKTNPGGKKEIGFLAQDIQQLIPEAVEAPGNGDAMGMKYTELIPVLVKAIQEQQQQINNQQKQIELLQQLLKKR